MSDLHVPAEWLNQEIAILLEDIAGPPLCVSWDFALARSQQLIARAAFFSERGINVPLASALSDKQEMIEQMRDRMNWEHRNVDNDSPQDTMRT